MKNITPIYFSIIFILLSPLAFSQNQEEDMFAGQRKIFGIWFSSDWHISFTKDGVATMGFGSGPADLRSGKGGYDSYKLLRELSDRKILDFTGSEYQISDYTNLGPNAMGELALASSFRHTDDQVVKDLLFHVIENLENGSFDWLNGTVKKNPIFGRTDIVFKKNPSPKPLRSLRELTQPAVTQPSSEVPAHGSKASSPSLPPPVSASSAPPAAPEPAPIRPGGQTTNASRWWWLVLLPVPLWLFWKRRSA